MKYIRQSLRKTAALAALVTGLAVGHAGTAGAQVLPTSPPPDPTCVAPPSTFNSWFQSGHPGLNQPVNPADSIAFQSSSNCNFYLWSEQMFLWLTSPATGAYAGNHVFDSQVFYQVSGGKLVQQGGLLADGKPKPLNLALRAAQVGPDGLPVIIDSKGSLREFVTAPSTSGISLLSATSSAKLAHIAEVKTGSNGKALFLNSEGKSVAFVPKVTADMLPATLGRLAPLATPPKGLTALSLTDERTRIAAALTAKNILIQVITKTGPVFVEAGTGIVDGLEPGQAGRSSGVLISQNNSVIFYETLVNDVYAWYLTGRKTPGGIAPLYNGNVAATYGLFPTTQNDLNAVTSFSSAHGGPSSFPDGVALAFETKLSWVDASTLPNGAQGYITMPAFVPVYDKSNPVNWKLLPQPKFVIVALVGVHVVGSVAGHPEMVWATFEHQDNTPLAAYQYNSGGQPVTVPQNTSGNWLFSSNGAAGPYNSQLGTYCNANIPPGCTSSDPVGTIAATSPPTAIGKSDILREKPWGVGTGPNPPNQEDATDAASNTEVISLDTNVQAQLAAAGASADSRYNYLFIGSTWTFGGGQPNGIYPLQPIPSGQDPSNPATQFNDEIGTSVLLNSTMETFQQGPDTTYATGTNCFGCHTAAGTNRNVKADTSVSHIFGSTSGL